MMIKNTTEQIQQYHYYNMYTNNISMLQVIGLLAALLNKKGNNVDTQRQKPQFIRQVVFYSYICNSTARFTKYHFLTIYIIHTFHPFPWYMYSQIYVSEVVVNNHQ